MPFIYPVIHLLDSFQAIEQVRVARNQGADGVFLIAHDGHDNEVISAAELAKLLNPSLRIGINLLSRTPMAACRAAEKSCLDMVWADDMGVDSRGGNAMAEELAQFARAHPAIELFASVAFKYRAAEPNPALAAQVAKSFGFVPTTSGAATGSAPDVQKIVSMSAATQGRLAIASGMTPENVASYAPHLSHILVATGIGLDEHHIDPQRLARLIVEAGPAAVA